MDNYGKFLKDKKYLTYSSKISLRDFEAMRLIRYKNKEAYLTEREWKSLLGRFDLTKVKFVTEFFPEKVDFFYIDQQCILCEKYKWRCSICPLGIAGEVGCCNLIKEIVKDLWKSFGVSELEIFWRKEQDKPARKAISKIHKALLALPKVKRKPSPNK